MGRTSRLKRISSDAKARTGSADVRNMTTRSFLFIVFTLSLTNVPALHVPAQSGASFKAGTLVAGILERDVPHADCVGFNEVALPNRQSQLFGRQLIMIGHSLTRQDAITKFGAAATPGSSHRPCGGRQVATHRAIYHAPAQRFMQTGFARFGRPCSDSWTSYGLGSENDSLPSFVVMNTGTMAGTGNSLWGNGFCRRFTRAATWFGRCWGRAQKRPPQGSTAAASVVELVLSGWIERLSPKQVPFSLR